MKTTVGVYDDHERALDAANYLSVAGFAMQSVSIIGVRNHLENDEKILTDKRITTMVAGEVGVGAAIGSTVGLLTGIGIIAIPGIGLLFGAGAIVGALVGLDAGLIGGSIAAALSIGAMKSDHETYDRHIKEGHYLLIVNGSDDDAAKAKELLLKHDLHLELKIH